MKLFYCFSVIALSFMSLNLTARADEKGFEADKAHALQSLDVRMSKLQELKSCISASTSREGNKACHQKHEEWAKSLKAENQERARVSIDESIKKLQEKKAKLEMKKSEMPSH